MYRTVCPVIYDSLLRKTLLKRIHIYPLIAFVIRHSRSGRSRRLFTFLCSYGMELLSLPYKIRKDTGDTDWELGVPRLTSTPYSHCVARRIYMRNRLSVCVDLIEELSVLIWRRNHGSKFEVWTRGYEVIPDPL